MQNYYQRLINYLEHLPVGITIIPKQGGTFNLEVIKGVDNQITGVRVSNLSQPFINIAAFEVALKYMYNSQDHTARIGNTRGGRLIEPMNSIDEQVAHFSYGKNAGDNCISRRTPIHRILEAAGVCVSKRRGYLTLKDL